MASGVTLPIKYHPHILSARTLVVGGGWSPTHKGESGVWLHGSQPVLQEGQPRHHVPYLPQSRQPARPLCVTKGLSTAPARPAKTSHQPLEPAPQTEDPTSQVPSAPRTNGVTELMGTSGVDPNVNMPENSYLENQPNNNQEPQVTREMGGHNSGLAPAPAYVIHLDAPDVRQQPH